MLRQNSLHHLTRFHAGEPEVEALEADGEAFVVEAEQVQHGRVKIIRRRHVYHAAPAEVIRLAIAETSLHTTTR